MLIHWTKTPKRIEARDRRLAAIHEAGHVTMGRHLGLIVAHALLKKVPNTDMSQDKLWIGHTQYLPPSLFKTKMSQKKLAMFAVSGAVAELCWQRASLDEALDEDRWCDPQAMSPSDWEGSGCEPGDPTRQFLKAVEATFELLNREAGKLWPSLLREARCLIEATSN